MGVPVVLFPVAGKGFDRAEARKLFVQLDARLEVINPDGLKQLRDHLASQGVDDLKALSSALLELLGLGELPSFTAPAANGHKPHTIKAKAWLGKQMSRAVSRLSSFSQEAEVAEVSTLSARSSRGSTNEHSPNGQPDVLEWQPWGTNQKIIATLSDLLDAMVRSAGRGPLNWNDPWEEAGLG